MTGQSALTLDTVTIRLGDTILVEDLSLTVPPGEVTTLMGPSGSGKSTVLAMICGTIPPAFSVSGSIRFGLETLDELPPEARGAGILFQDDLLFLHLSVAENVAFGLPPAIRGHRQRTERACEILSDAGLEDLAGQDPSTLSGGQRARVALLRTLAAEPRVLLLDEPFSRLDVPLRARFRRFVFRHARQRGLPTLLVTHDPADAEAAGGEIVTLWNESRTSG